MTEAMSWWGASGRLEPQVKTHRQARDGHTLPCRRGTESHWPGPIQANANQAWLMHLDVTLRPQGAGHQACWVSRQEEKLDLSFVKVVTKSMGFESCADLSLVH